MYSTAKRADLEALLRTRRLDRTVVDPAAAPPIDTLAPTGLPIIDTALRGGFPRGQLSELIGARSSGRTTVLHAACAAATSRGELVAVVDSLDMFDPVSAADAGVDLDRLLWVRGSVGAHGSPGSLGLTGHASQGSLLQEACERAIKAFNLILVAGGYGMAVLDLADIPAIVLRRIPIITWLRLQRGLEGRETAGLVIADTHLGRSARGVTLELASASPTTSTSTASTMSTTFAQSSPWALPPFELTVARCQRAAGLPARPALR